MPNAYNKDHGLQLLSEDKRDISRTKVFGVIPRSFLTTENFLIVPPVEIMNQDINYYSDFCAAYGLTAASEAQDGIPEVPEYTFAKAKQLLIVTKEKQLGRASTDQEKADIINSFGLNLRDIMEAGRKFGFLERNHDPFDCNTDKRPDRNFLSDYRHWPSDLDSLAWEHAKNSYLAVDGPYDIFDNFRMCLLTNRQNREAILTGAYWRESWSNAPGGVVDDTIYTPSEQGSGHAFAIIGQSMTEKGLCLVAQLSDGDHFGDHGLFYFTRSVANREFAYGAYHFSTIPKATLQVHNDFDFTLDASAWTKFWKIALYYIKSYIAPKK